MQYLEKNEIRQLNSLKDLIVNNGKLDVIKSEAMKITVRKSSLFPFVYAGCLLAVYDRIADSVTMLEQAAGDVFADVVRNYIEKTCDFKPAVTVFQKALPYTAWTKSNLCMEHFRAVLNSIEDFARNHPPENLDSVSIADVGTGNGILISEIVNRILEVYPIRHIDLMLLDPSEGMLETAVRHCHSNIKTRLTISTECCRVQELDQRQKDRISGKAPFWFSNSALSIHHMPWEQKIPVLSFLKGISRYCIIEEMNFNHDIPEKDSPELIFALSRNYGIIFSDIFESRLTSDERDAAIEQFFLAEGINMMRNQRAGRIDFHTTADEWESLAHKAGLKVEKVYDGCMRDGRIITFVMVLD